VAVRTPPQGANKAIKTQFMREMALAQRVGHHNNVVAFVGQCSKAQPLMIMRELCTHGNLRDYLRASRASNSVTMEMRLRFAHDVASGMAYLEGRGIVHGDLAAYGHTVIGFLF
jgi:insulin receptor